MNAKENKKRHKYKGEYLEKSNPRGKYKDAPENRLKQREANYKVSEKEEEVSRVLYGFSLTLRPR